MTESSDTIQAIDTLRAQIDDIDAQIVDLLNERATRSLAIRALKPAAQLGLYDPRREEEIFERVASHNKGPLYSDDLRTVYATILRVSKEMHL